jgi:hypothetical protein
MEVGAVEVIAQKVLKVAKTVVEEAQDKRIWVVRKFLTTQFFYLSFKSEAND